MSSFLTTLNYRLLEPDADKIRAARGFTPRRVVVEAANHAFTEMNLYTWEKNISQPDPQMTFVLAKALGVPIAEITREAKITTP